MLSGVYAPVCSTDFVVVVTFKKILWSVHARVMHDKFFLIVVIVVVVVVVLNGLINK